MNCAEAGHCPCWRRGDDECCGCSIAAKRKCYFINEAEWDDDGYIPSLMVEGVRGHRLLWDEHWGSTLVAAQTVCRERNQALGLSAQDIADIIVSCQFPA